MTRTPFVGGNWKMNTGLESGPALARSIAELLADRPPVQVAIYPPFPFLAAVRDVLGDAGVVVGAQDLSDEPKGAFTGEVSADMLKECGVRSVLVGHSERRHVIGEADELINRKFLRALESDLEVVLCVGETLEQRDAHETDTVNRRQLTKGLVGVPKVMLDRIVIAYEPVWAIGTGKTASAADAQDAHEKIRGVIAGLYDADTADAVRIVYGGSVKASNASELFASPDIDGGLIGGASLDADEFTKIVRAAAQKETAR